MVFCIRGTGETREIDFRDSNGVDWAAKIAQDIRLWEADDVFYDDEQAVYVASRWTVECWQKYFEIFAENDQELRALKSKYADYEVDGLCFEKRSGGYPDSYEMKDMFQCNPYAHGDFFFFQRNLLYQVRPASGANFYPR